MPSPFILDRSSVTQVMAWVLAALLPGVVAYVWLFGPAILVTLALATVTALAAEAAMLKARGYPAKPFLTDLSAIVTAWLLVRQAEVVDGIPEPDRGRPGSGAHARGQVVAFQQRLAAPVQGQQLVLDLGGGPAQQVGGWHLSLRSGCRARRRSAGP